LWQLLAGVDAVVEGRELGLLLRVGLGGVRPRMAGPRRRHLAFLE